MMRELRAIALAYDPLQDRMLAVVNPGHLDSWSFWLTRRLVLEVLGRLPAALAGSSAMLRQAPAQYRDELAAFEREAAIASTDPAMQRTDQALMTDHARVAELVVNLAIAEQGEHFMLQLTGERGAQAAGVLERAELQRMLQMIYDETAKGGWLGLPGSPVQADPAQAGAATPTRH